MHGTALCIVYAQFVEGRSCKVTPTHPKSCKVMQSHAKSCEVMPGYLVAERGSGLRTVSPGRPKMPAEMMAGVAPPHLCAPASAAAAASASASASIAAPRLMQQGSRFTWSNLPTCKIWVGDLPASAEGAKECLREALPTNGPARWTTKPGRWGYHWALLTFDCPQSAINAYDRLLRYRMRNGRHLVVRYLEN